MSDELSQIFRQFFKDRADLVHDQQQQKKESCTQEGAFHQAGYQLKMMGIRSIFSNMMAKPPTKQRSKNTSYRV
jgi:hypothetical protein